MVVKINPIFNYINAMREIVMYGTLPTTAECLRMVIWAAAAFIIGNIVFNKNKNKIMQKI